MTIALEWARSQVSDFEADRMLQQDIKHLIDNLDLATHNVIYDYQEVEGIEYVLIDTHDYHYQIQLHNIRSMKGHDSGKVELMRQQYLSDGRLGEPYEVEIVNIPQFVCCFLG